MPFLRHAHEALAAEYVSSALPGADVFIGIDSIFNSPSPEGGVYITGGFEWTEVSNPDADEFVAIDFLTRSSEHRTYHYRFIAVPNPLTLNNPALNSNIPFHVWNTFPFPDTALAVNITGTSVLTSDLEATVSIRDFQWAEYNIQISAGESSIDALLVGDYTQGDFELSIVGVLVVDIQLIPEEEVNETWKWNTVITSSWNGEEQRIRLSPAPQRNIEMAYVTDEDQMVELSRRLYQSTVGLLTVPFYQYSTSLTAQSLLGSDELFFNPSYTNFKVGDVVYIRNPNDDEALSGVIQVVESLTLTGCILEGALGQTVEQGWVVCPAFTVYLDQPGQQFSSKTGRFRLSAETVNRGRILTRDGASATLTLFNDRPVVTQRILEDVTDQWVSKFDTFNNGFGSLLRVTSWPYPKFQRSLRFRVNMKQAQTEFDRWMLFFDTVAGAHKPFYVPSGVADLKLASPGADGSNTLSLLTQNYSTVYFGNPIYNQIQVQFADKTTARYEVASAVPQLDGTDTLTLSDGLPGTVEINPIEKISFLYLVRMGTDEVQAQFINNRAYFSFSIVGTSG